MLYALYALDALCRRALSSQSGQSATSHVTLGVSLLLRHSVTMWSTLGRDSREHRLQPP